MNNDLTKLSDNELRLKREDIRITSSHLTAKKISAQNRYDKLTKKRRINPVILLAYKKEVEQLEVNLDLLSEYSRTLIDEVNRRN